MAFLTHVLPNYFSDIVREGTFLCQLLPFLKLQMMLARVTISVCLSLHLTPGSCQPFPKHPVSAREVFLCAVEMSRRVISLSSIPNTHPTDIPRTTVPAS